jgi:hypothetical protein
VDLVWQVQEAPANVTVFVHLLNAEGQLIGQADGEPLGGSLPFISWPGSRPIEDTRWLASGDGAGTTVLVGLYDRASGERMAAYDGAGGRLADDALAIPVALP